MTSHGSDRPPERLLHGKYGALLRQANLEWESGLDEAAAFRRVAARLAASRSQRVARTRRLVAAAPFAVAAMAAALVVARRQSVNVAPELVAEHWRPAATPATPPSVATGAVSAVAKAAEPPRAELKRESHVAKPRPDAVLALPSASPATKAEPLVEAKPSAVPSSSADTTTELAPVPDCLNLARQGQARAAEGCFSERAQGAGLAAEMALYELARLRRDVLADANGALRALTDYRTRFPSGSLRREVDVSQLELLLQLGRSEEALKQSAELLASSSGERASELRMLRGHVLRKQSRFAEAEREYELAESAGARGSAALYFRALCLEASGRTSQAAAAFAKYLEQPQRPYAEDARRRLEKLTP